MLDALPLPKPDELLYSIFARLAWRLQLPNKKDLLNLLFGQGTGVAVWQLPTLLGAFQSRLPQAHPLAAAHLPEEFTLFPLYAPFMEPGRADQLEMDMMGDGGNRASLRAGVMAHGLARNGLRACPRCIAEDLRSRGESYWRRLHQAPGVVVCNTHKIHLVDTGIAGPSRINRQEFLLPPDAIATKATAELSPHLPEHQDLLRLAEYAQMGLARRQWRMSLHAWENLYRQCLRERGYATGSKYCDAGRLVSDFCVRFKPDFLRQIGCNSPASACDSWLVRLVRRPQNSLSALHHFLLWLFLDLTPDQVLARATAGIPIHREISADPQPSKRPGRSADWNARLQGLWEDTNLSLRTIAHQLKVEPITVKRHAVKLGLLFPRKCVRPTTTAGVDQMIQRGREQVHRLTQRRKAWLKLQERHPEMGAKALRRLKPALYAALYRADRNWLMSNQPKRRRIQVTSRIDWPARDRALRKQLENAQVRLIVSPDRPRQATLASLGRIAGARALLEKHSDKLPECRKFLREATEDRVKYALRRLGYAAALVQNAGEIPVRWKLLRMAGIRSDLAANQKVSNYVDELVANGVTQVSSASRADLRPGKSRPHNKRKLSRAVSGPRSGRSL